MKVPLLLITGAAALAGSPAAAQTSDPTDQQRVRQMIVYGSDPCPRGSVGEIVVCARRPDSERYRIPKQFRDDATVDDQQNQLLEAEAIEGLTDSGIGSCSPTGPGGASGCWADTVSQFRRERASRPPPE